MPDRLEDALVVLRQRRAYAQHADDDAEQADRAVTDAQSDLLEAIAERLLEGPPASRQGTTCDVCGSHWEVEFDLTEHRQRWCKQWRHKDGSIRTDHMDTREGDYFGV
jgi:hypothetical protein